MRSILIPLMAALLCTAAAHADSYNERGLKTYKKLCKSCHGSSFRGAAMLKGYEWEEMFGNNEAKMIAAHQGDAEALKVFERSYYQTRKKYLFDFLSKNAKDSGVVPGCDANYCGN
jgi:hypothetical protein